MTHVHEQQRYDTGADELWGRIGGFHSIAAWHPAIGSQTAEGGEAVRELHLVDDGGTVVETLLEQGERTYTYRIDSCPLPVRDYTATIAVSQAGDGGCVVDWTADFEPDGASEDEAKAVISGIFTTGMGAL